MASLFLLALSRLRILGISDWIILVGSDGGIVSLSLHHPCQNKVIF